MTHLNDHIKQQQEVNRGKAEEAVFPIPLSLLKLPKEDVKRVDEEIYKVIDTLTADTIEKTVELVIPEVLKLADELELECNRDGDKGTKQWMAFKGFRNTIRDRLLTQLEDSNN